MSVDLERAIDNLREDFVQAVQECLRIKSVKDMEHAVPGAPFGPGIRQCLDWTLALGEELGFQVRDIDGYAGEIDLGDGELIAVLGHLDVVPEGDGWTVSPYGGEMRDGKVFGRGAMDDKGPTLAVLFAMKALRDAKIPMRKGIRLILGTDEESGWADMEYYKKHRHLPALGFAPDADFPVIHAEKGILHVEMTKRLPELTHLVEVKGGQRPNIVPDVCRAVLRKISATEVNGKLNGYELPEGVSIQCKELPGDQITVICRGVSAHGSLPHQGKNAIIYLLDLLRQLPLDQAELEWLNYVLAHPGYGVNGEGLGIDLSDEPSGRLSLNLGILELNPGFMRLVVDIRYPVTYRRDDIWGPIEKTAAPAGYSLNITSDMEPHFVPKDSPLVKALLSAYTEVSGQEGYAFAIGGGTYAKVLPQGVAFGPLFPGEPEVIHCADEYISIDNLIRTAKIYALALAKLAG